MTRGQRRADHAGNVDRADRADPSHRANHADRGQANWIGFVFLLALAAVAFTTYQTTLVPQHTAAVEFDHQQAVEASFHELGAAVTRAARRGGTLPVTLDPGVSYPLNPLAIQPPPARGRLATAAGGGVDLSVGGTAVNLSAACGYGGATVRSRALEYRPSYNQFDGATVGYEHGVVYTRTDSGARAATDGLPFLAGETLSLTPLAGERRTTSVDPVTLDLHGGPVRSRRLPEGPTTLTLPTGLPAATWERLATNESAVTGVERTDEGRVRFHLAAEAYTLTCAGVGLGAPAPSGVAPLGATPGGSDSPGDPAAADPSLSLDIRDRTRGQAARFDAIYVVEGVDDPSVEVTFRHPSAPDASDTRRAADREGELSYDGPRNSRWERDDGEVERGTPAPYDITVIVHDAAGDPVLERTVTEVADGDEDAAALSQATWDGSLGDEDGQNATGDEG